MRPPRTREWAALWPLIPMGPTELAERLGITRQGVHFLQHGEHARVPVKLLGKLAALLKRRGLADGSKPPDRGELVRAWIGTFLLCEPRSRGVRHEPD